MDTLLQKMKSRREKLRASLDLEMAARGRTFIAMDFESRLQELTFWIQELEREDASLAEAPQLSAASAAHR